MLGICRHRKHPVRYGTGCQISWFHALKEEENKNLGRQRVNKQKNYEKPMDCMIANQLSYVTHSAPESKAVFALGLSFPNCAMQTLG